jgi:hypothetical protein
MQGEATSTTAAPRVAPPESLEILSSGDYSIVETLIAAVAEQPSIAAEAEAIAQSMAAKGQITELQMRDAVAAIRGGRGSTTAGPRPDSRASSVPDLVGYVKPNTANRAWFIRRWITATECSGSKVSCVEIARIRAEFTVNVGARASSISYGVNHLDPEGVFYNERIGSLANYDGIDSGSNYVGADRSKSGTFTVDHSQNRRGKPIRHYVTVQGSLDWDTRVEHRGRTGWADCRTSDDVCIYRDY